MPRSVVGERCHFCGRMLYASDFRLRNAEIVRFEHYYDGPEEYFQHTYDLRT